MAKSTTHTKDVNSESKPVKKKPVINPDKELKVNPDPDANANIPDDKKNNSSEGTGSEITDGEDG